MLLNNQSVMTPFFEGLRVVENGTLVGLSHSDSVLESVHQFNTGQRGFQQTREANSPKWFVVSEVNSTEINKVV